MTADFPSESMAENRGNIFEVLKGNGICKSRNVYLYQVEYFYFKNKGFFEDTKAQRTYQLWTCTSKNLKEFLQLEDKRHLMECWLYLKRRRK